MKTGMRTYILICSLIAGPAALSAAEPSAEKPAATAKQEQFFEKKVRPLLVARCQKCHGEKKQQGGLRLDSREATIVGGDSGEAVDLESPGESLLLEAISYDPDAVVEMPPDGKLKPDEIAILTKWVKWGAPWPASRPTTRPRQKPTGPLFSEAEKNYWAFRTPEKPDMPDLKNAAWPRTGLDHFVLAKLEEQGLTPAPQADKRTWLRRATFDLWGLPPSPQEVAEFLADDSPDAYRHVIDRLLASPRYGERWGRHWLDVARYADSNGMDENLAYANAYHYRDYVIAAFNKDKPFDLFVREQIAGDLMVGPNDGETAVDRYAATAFLAIGPKMLAEDDPVKMRVDIVDEQIDTIGRAFMGMTLGCARCHAHKFDPIPQEDYYSLAGIFLSTKTMKNYKVVADWFERPLAPPEEVAALREQEQQIKQRETAIEELQKSTNKKLLSAARLRVGDYLLAATEWNQFRATNSAQQPILAAAAENLPEGTLLIEAEKFRRGNVNRDTSSYGKGVGVLVNAGKLPNFAEYEIEVPKADQTYQLEFRVAAAESRPVKLSLNGKLVEQGAITDVTGGWYPKSQRWVVCRELKLQQGSNTLRLERDGPFPHIDKLALVPLDSSRSPQLTAEELAARFDLRTSFLTQWADYLNKTQADKDSVLAEWHALLKSQNDSDNELFSEFRAESRKRLAARYQELFKDAEQSWRKLQADSSEKPPKKLSNASQEAFRMVLYHGEGPFAVSEKTEVDYPQDTVAKLKSLRGEVKSLKETLPKFPLSMGVTEDEIQNARVNIRGNHVNLGAEVPRQFPQIMAGEKQDPIDNKQSGRLQFAEWLASADHPLTSRVIVNRVWRWHFGAGIVPTPDNFGTTGELPVNQPLLDYLAVEFVEQGWSIKELHRRIMLSSTYRMSTRFDEAAASVDPENKSLWRMNRRRLSAEEIRDGILGVAGTIDFAMGGSLMTTKNHAYVASTASVDGTKYETNRRSIYLPVIRSGLFEMFGAFDFPDPSSSNGDRATTTVAPQALFLLNSRFMDEQSAAMASRLLSGEADDPERLRQAYQRALGRDPTAEESKRAEEFLARYETALADREDDPATRKEKAWQAVCRVLLSSSEFLYVD